MDINKLVDACLNIVQTNKLDEYTALYHTMKILPKSITTMTIIRNPIIDSQVFSNIKSTCEFLNLSMIMTYCIYNKPIKIHNKYKSLTCWLCDGYGTNDRIFKYDTIFDTHVTLHTWCYDECHKYRNQCQKKIVSKYTCLYSNSHIIIYNMSEIFVIQFYNHLSVNYNLSLHDAIVDNILKPYTGHWLTKFKPQYINLVKKDFINNHYRRLLLIRSLIIDDVNNYIVFFYIKVILFISKEDIDLMTPNDEPDIHTRINNLLTKLLG